MVKCIVHSSLSLLFLWPVFTFAKGHELQCGADGVVKDFTSKIDGKACDTYSKLGTKSCGDSAIVGENKKKITLMTPVNTYHASRNSSQYDRKMIEEIIKKAVAHGQDPYMYLAIMMVESPVTNEKGIQYIESYGIPPLDAIAAVDGMNCRKENETIQVKEKQFIPLDEWKGPKPSEDKIATDGKTGKKVVVTFGPKPKKVEHAVSNNKPSTVSLFGATDATAENIVLMMDYARLAANPIYYLAPREHLNASACGETCCSDLLIPKQFMAEKDIVRGDRRVYEKNDEGISRSRFKETPQVKSGSALDKEINAALGARFIDNKFDSARRMSFVKGAKSKEDKLAKILQSYNGYGVFGATEKMDNNCLKGVSMKEKPIYGAGVADLILNALMANSEVRDMVEKYASGSKQPVKSLLCEEYGEGTHQLDPLAYAQLQQKYMSGRKGCPKKSFGFGVPEVGVAREEMPVNVPAEPINTPPVHK